MTTETITWHDMNEPPSNDRSVIVGCSAIDHGGVVLVDNGYFNGRWRDLCGYPFEPGFYTHWTEMRGPQT